jgi:hypothetical protein
MVKLVTHLCDNCGRETWGEDVHRYKGKEFCSDECAEEYAQEEASQEAES